MHVQVFRRAAETYYTIDDLAVKWHRKRWTVIDYLKQIRKSHHAPTPEQVKRIGPNAARRYVLIREDYAALMRVIFIERKIPLK